MSVGHGHLVVEEIPRIPHAEAMALARSQNDAFLSLLRELSPEEWSMITDCAPWTVRDIAAHVLGWAEAVLSPKELYRQMKGSVQTRKEWANIVDAQNGVQVRDRKALSDAELVARLEEILPRFLKARHRLSYVLKPIPTYNGMLGLISLGFVAETIFTRDLFIHRIDITKATGCDFTEGPSEARIVGDCLREWGRRAQARAHLILGGAAGGEFSVGDVRQATIRASAVDFMRLLSGRPRGESVEIEGDTVAAESWISKGCRF